MEQARGTLRDFSASIATADPGEVWRRWTTPSTWPEWDLGLSDARLAGPFVPGAQGTITDRSGRESRFVVEEVDVDLRRVRWHVPLPGARLELVRCLLDSGTAEHRVRFVGPLSWPWAGVLARGFRSLLPPTLNALATTRDEDD